MGAKRTTAAIAAVLAAAGLGPAVLTASAAGTKTFSDPVGDAGTGFDVANVVVSNDSTGQITFRVGLPAVSALPSSLALGISMNTDLKPTGGNAGIDFSIIAIGGQAGLSKVNSGGLSNPTIPQSLSTSFQPGLMTVSINRKDLGGTHGFQFFAVTLTELPDGSIDPGNSDVAPPGFWSYDLKLPTKLAVSSVGVTPPRPAAGGAFAAGMTVRDTTFDAPGVVPVGGTVKCAFSAGGKSVTTQGSITRAGRVTCRGHVPDAATGQSLTGTVKFRLNGVTASRSFSTRIR